MTRSLLSLALALLTSTLVAAQKRVETNLYTRVDDGTIRAAIQLEIDDGWHLYHTELGHPEAVGQPTSVTLSGEGITWGEVVWPEPHRFSQEEFGPGVFILGHEGEVVLFASGTLAPGATGEDAGAKLAGLTCEKLCIPYRADVRTKGAGPDALFASFPDEGDDDDLLPGLLGDVDGGSDALAGDVPTEDVIQQGEADSSLFVRRDGDTLTAAIRVSITPGWHLYHDDLSRGHPEAAGKPTRVTLHGAGVTWGPVHFPEPHEMGQGYEWEGEEVWIHGHEGDIVLWAEGRVSGSDAPGPIWAEIQGQTCEGLCIDYLETFVSQGEGPDGLFDEVEAARAALAAGGGQADHGEASRGESSKQSDDDDGLLAFLLLAVGGGLFALLMPCTYPMVPITISFFTKQAEARGGKVLPLSLAYGAGIILIFVLIGVLIGPAIIKFATHPVTNFTIGALFVIFAFALFGVINLEPPRSMMNLAGKASTTGGYLGVFLMGMTLVITSFTCTVPFVGSILSVGGTDGDLTRLVLGMATFGATMAIPFVFLSLVPGRVQALPRSGEWMNTLKHFLGFVELAAALKFFSNTDLVQGWNVISRELFLVAWAVLFVAAAAYLLGAFAFLGKGPKPKVGAGRFLGAALSMAFALYCGWAARGKPLDPIMTAIVPAYSGGELFPELYIPEGRWKIVKDDYDAALSEAGQSDKLLLVNLTGHT